MTFLFLGFPQPFAFSRSVSYEGLGRLAAHFLRLFRDYAKLFGLLGLGRC